MLADGHARAARAVDDHLRRFHRLADDLQRVEQRRRDDDGRSVLIVVENGNIADFLQPALDLKAARRGDVFQIDAAEAAGNQVDRPHQLVHVLRAHAQGEGVHAREFLEEHTLALHHRHARLRADIAQTEDRRAIRDDGDHVRPPREQIALFIIVANREARLGHARRIREGEFFAVGDMGARRDFDFPLPLVVLFQRFLLDIHKRTSFLGALPQMFPTPPIILESSKKINPVRQEKSVKPSKCFQGTVFRRLSMKLTRQQVLDLLVRAEAAGLLPADGPTSLFVAQKRGAPLQLAVAAAGSKIVVRQSRLPFSRPLVFSRAELAHP